MFITTTKKSKCIRKLLTFFAMAHLNTFCLDYQVLLAKKKGIFNMFWEMYHYIYCIYRENIQFLLMDRHNSYKLFNFRSTEYKYL